MKKLKQISIFVVCILLGFGVGLTANDYLIPRFKDYIAKHEKQETAVAAETDIHVSSFSEIPTELPDEWTTVEVSTKLPAVALGSDFPETYNPGGHDGNDGYELAIFYDENHSYYITAPTINTVVAEMCAEHNYGIIAVSIYNKSTYRLETGVIFYDPTKEITVTLKSSNWSIDSDEPYFSYSGGAFGSVSNLVTVGSSDNEPNLWTKLNTPYLWEKVEYSNVGWSVLENPCFYEFNPYRIMIHEDYVDEGRKTPVELISGIFNSYEIYEEALDEQIGTYTRVLPYFTDVDSVKSDDPEMPYTLADDPEMPENFIPSFADFDLESCARDYFGAEVKASYDPSYGEIKNSTTGETDEMLWDATEIINIRMNGLTIGIVYTYSFGAMDDELWSVTVNGKELDYDTVYGDQTRFRSEDLSSEVKIGEEANIDRAYFDYIIALMLEASNK